VAYDKLLQLTSDDANGVPRQTITASGESANVRYFGKSRAFRAKLRIGGAVSGTNETLDVVIQASADGSTGWTTIATFPQQTATDDLLEGQPIDGDTTTESNIAVVVGATPSDKPYVRASWTVGGTGSPSFGGVSVLCEPLGAST
jgi:hypothetical protein